MDRPATATATANDTPKIRIAIIGAGIAGTCLAAGLLRDRGGDRLDVHLYEARPGVEVRGAGLALHGNALAAMDAVSPAVRRAYFRASHRMASDADLEMATAIVLGSGAAAGEVVAELGRAKGRRTVHRAHFIRGLMEEKADDDDDDDGGVLAVPPERVHFGKKLVGISQLDGDEHGGGGGVVVVAAFADGARERFDVLFGAEGVHSLTRAHVLGRGHPAAGPVNHDGWRCFNVLVPAAEAEAALPRASIETVRMLCTPRGYVNGLPVDRGRTYSVTCYQRDGKMPPAKRGRPFDAAEWKGFSREVDLLISLLERDPREDWKILDHDPAPTYTRGGCVAVIGDAAHATAPHAGNGAAQAIEDAAVLAGVFARARGRADAAAALGAFDAARRPRSQRVVELTREFGRLYSLDEAERDVGEMRRRMREGGAYTNGVDMGAQVEGAVERFERERR